ncbi:MAG TPA: terminase TerL endonuclease subunit [Trebonia sp.]|jgi:phage terminase large subunit-like protein|nr:terminase TerL endonuclease subunit [Trebonia sp.]
MADRRRFPPCGRVFDGQTCLRRGAHYCAPRADHAMAFFTELLVHTKGVWARQAFIPAAWEEAEVIRPLFGTVYWEPGWGMYVRQYRELYLSTGRKNGKTELIAGLSLYFTIADGEEAAEMYGLALDKDQAGLAFAAAARMVALSPPLARRLSVALGARRIYDERTASFFTVAAGDALGALGTAPQAAYIDELLAQPSRELYDAIRTGFGTRPQPVLMLVTTADSDPSGFAASERAWSEKVLEDPSLDPARLVVLHAAPAEADWTKEETWKLANPALGDYLDPRILADECRKAQANPAAERAFRQFRLNQQSQEAGRAIALDAWDRCAPVTEDLAGRACYGGLDLGSTIDLASYALDFPGGGGHDVLYRVFAPEAALPKLDRRTGGKATAWREAGLLTVTEGDVIDYEAIKAAMREDAERYEIREIAFDRWGATQLSLDLLDEGFPLFQTGQGFASMSGPTKEFLRLVAAGAYRHGGNPVARWQAANLIVRTDPSGNQKPDRARSADKIDSMVAGIMALDRAIRHAEPQRDYAAAGF